MRSIWLPAIVLAWVIAAPVVAREAADDAEAPATTDESEGDDEVIVRGKTRGRRDPAMDAFRRGDFKEAELEFDKSQTCARRIQILKDAALEQAVVDAIRSESSARAGAGGGPPQFVHNVPRRADQIPERNCDREDWQLYMMGLSQIQLGKYAEAKATFYRVIALSKDELLYDAHYRIALLEILDGNLDKAEKRLRYLQKLQRRCERKGDRCEIREELDEVVAYLENAIKEAR